MAKFTIFKLDPRIAADLKTQRAPITRGLICTAVTAALTGFTIKMTETMIGVTESLSRLASNSRAGIEQADSEALTHQLLVKLGWSCLLVIAVFAIKYVFTRGQMYYMSVAANQLAANLRVRLLRKLQQLPVGYFAGRRAGAIQSVLSNDVNVYQSAVGVIRDSVEGPIKIIVALGMILYYQPRLVVFSIVLIPVLSMMISRNGKRMRKAQTKVQEDLADVGAMTQELIQGVRIVKAFGAESRALQSFESVVDRGLRSQNATALLVANLRPLVELMGAVALAMFFYYSGLLARDGLLHVSAVAALAFAMDSINQGFRSVTGLSNTYKMVQAATDRLYSEILDVPEQHETPGGQTIPEPRGAIEFDHVTFRYPDGTEALSDVSFTIDPGSSLALVGPSGAGKTTIADLLLRFYEPSAGRILFDGIDLRELDLAWLRSQIGVVPQHTFLFAGSIEDNLRLARPDATEDEIAEALEQAHAKEFAYELSQRNDAELGERGVKLSGGQMQRVAIARAIVRKPTILLLDEATSALDATSEKIVTDALDAIMRTRTSLFIAHRLTTAARADRILVLSRGRVVETGSHAELMEANGAYAGLFRAFSGGLLEA